MEKNLIMNGDSYKMGHWKLYPPETTYNFSYLESRGSDKERNYKDCIFFGLQYIIKEYLSKGITMDDVLKAQAKAKVHGVPFNIEGWTRIVEKHGGKYPIKIRAVPEGTVVPLHNVLLTVESTDKELSWLESYVETMLVRLWYPIVVATESYYTKKVIRKYLQETADNLDSLDFMLQDFGSRGVSSQESAMIGGAAHLVNFKGTDTLDALDFLEEYYHSYCAGFSVVAGEHSTFSSWGRDREAEAYRNMIKQYGKPNAILSFVSDTWDIYNACEKIWGEELKQEVIDSGIFLVIRPDSGYPVEVVLKCLEILGNKFGTTLNSKGFKVINHNVKILQGDGIERNMIEAILLSMKKAKWSASNIACFGMGGALLQKHNRDTLKMAYKESYTINDRGGVDVYKDPITDKGKTSKKGRLDLITLQNGELQTVVLEDNEPFHRDTVMQTYYLNGEILVDEDFETIRKRAEKY
jgi:nicotinamide phosphoribosyltransferase